MVTPIRETTREKDILPWKDILHEGPAPAGLSLEKMSDVRARFLAGCGWGTYKEIRREFGFRDSAILSEPEITLWFQHDLGDQLKLIQILSALAPRNLDVQLVCTGQYMGPMEVPQRASLWKARQSVSAAQFALAERAWAAFCSPDRSALDAFLTEDLAALPFLGDALRRHVEDFPAQGSGLSRTDRQILETICGGTQVLKKVFWAFQVKEQTRYMSETVLDLHIKRMTRTRPSLLTAAPVMLTTAGHQVLAGQLCMTDLAGAERWHGGVHLQRTSG